MESVSSPAGKSPLQTQSRACCAQSVCSLSMKVLYTPVEAVGSWWVPRTSNPVWGASSVLGRFDSCALPPVSDSHHIIYLAFLSPHQTQVLFHEVGNGQGFKTLGQQRQMGEIAKRRMNLYAKLGHTSPAYLISSSSSS
jgi:hypothetical protein